MDENTVVTTTTDVTTPDVVEQTETVKTEPAKDEKPNAEIEKLKAALSKASADAAEWKRQFRAKQTEQERAEAERAEQEQAMRDELATLRKEKAVSDYTAKCVSLKMDADLAAQTANALADGNIDAMFECLKAFVEATETRLNNEMLNRQPGLSAGIPPTTNTTVDTDYENMRRWMMGASSRR